MSVEITHVRYGSTSKTHETIIRYKWRGIETNETGDNDKPSMVAWVDESGNHAYVGSGSSRVEVGVVRPDSGQPYLRTYADGKWSNNLLSLPEF